MSLETRWDVDNRRKRLYEQTPPAAWTLMVVMRSGLDVEVQQKIEQHQEQLWFLQLHLYSN